MKFGNKMKLTQAQKEYHQIYVNSAAEHAQLCSMLQEKHETLLQIVEEHNRNVAPEVEIALLAKVQAKLPQVIKPLVS